MQFPFASRVTSRPFVVPLALLMQLNKLAGCEKGFDEDVTPFATLIGPLPIEKGPVNIAMSLAVPLPEIPEVPAHQR